MLRRDIRLRKEYLYRKSLEGKQKEEYEKKQKIREALAGRRLFRGVVMHSGKKGPHGAAIRGGKVKAHSGFGG